MPDKDNPVERIAGGRFKRIGELDVARQEQLREMLEKGMSTHEAARVVQEEWGEWLDIKLDTARKFLERWKKGGGINLLGALEHVDPKTAGNLRRMAVEAVDLMHEYADLLDLINNRLEIVHERELQTGFPLGITDDVIRSKLALLKDYGDLAVKAGVAKELMRLTRNAERRGHYIPPDMLGQLVEMASAQSSDKPVEG